MILSSLRARSPTVYLGEWNESRENARASGEPSRGRGKAPRSRVLARLASLAQIGELAHRQDPLQFFYWEFSAMSKQKSRSLKTSHFPQDMGSTKMWMADNCGLPKISGRLNLPYQAFAFPEIVPSAPITMDITVTLARGSVDFFNFKSAGLNSN